MSNFEPEQESYRSRKIYTWIRLVEGGLTDFNISIQVRSCILIRNLYEFRVSLNSNILTLYIWRLRPVERHPIEQIYNASTFYLINPNMSSNLSFGSSTDLHDYRWGSRLAGRLRVQRTSVMSHSNAIPPG